MRGGTGFEANEAQRFAGLDLLRGLAALSVLALHLPWPPGIPAPLPRGYLAVDLFFLLSGFVIAHAYSERLGTPALLRQFCLARLIRLYPLYCAATLLAAAEMLAYTRIGSGKDPNITVDNVMSSLASAIFFLPTPPSWSMDPLTFFPLVFPAWSLFWELWVNLIYGVSRPRLGPGIVALLMAIGAVGILLAEHRYGAAGGTSWDGFWAGAARALFSFFAGVVVYRVRKNLRAPAVPVLLLAVVLVVAFIPRNLGGSAYDVACMVLLFPLLVWFGGEASMGPQVRAAGTFLGYLSYPVYLLQAPLLLLCLRVERLAGTGTLLRVPVDAIIVLLGSWLVARWFDTPVRKWLRRRFVPHAPQPRAETAP